MKPMFKWAMMWVIALEQPSMMGPAPVEFWRFVMFVGCGLWLFQKNCLDSPNRLPA